MTYLIASVGILIMVGVFSAIPFFGLLLVSVVAAIGGSILGEEYVNDFQTNFETTYFFILGLVASLGVRGYLLQSFYQMSSEAMVILALALAVIYWGMFFSARRWRRNPVLKQF